MSPIGKVPTLGVGISKFDSCRSEGYRIEQYNICVVVDQLS